MKSEEKIEESELVTDDLGSFEVRNTIKVLLMHPRDSSRHMLAAGKPMWVEVYTADSREYRRAMFDARRATMEMEDGYDKNEAFTLAMLAAVVKSWNVVFNGEHLPVTEKNVKRIMSEYRFIHDQVDLALHDRANFVKASDGS